MFLRGEGLAEPVTLLWRNFVRGSDWCGLKNGKTGEMLEKPVDWRNQRGEIFLNFFYRPSVKFR
ncbi:hypothetical protein DRN50_08125 [Thermococci archaeon]|nr:MAG: hypothetical protein DRN50_08125 [Thermococci archaeon]